MLVLADMLPTLLELSMLPSVRLSLKLMLKLFTIPMEDMALDTVPILLDMDMVMVIMLDSATLPLAMVIMVMVLDTVHTPLDMADTLAMDTDMVVGMVMGMAMDTMVELLSVNQHILVRSHLEH